MELVIVLIIVSGTVFIFCTKTTQIYVYMKCYFITCVNNSVVILHPRTTVALSNKTAYFSCYDNETASDKQITLNINGDMFVNNEQENIDKGINRDFILDENNKQIGFNISIIATEENNNTVIQCFFSPCFSNQAFLIVVEGKIVHYNVHN